MLIWVAGVPQSVTHFLNGQLERKLAKNGYSFSVIGFESPGFEPTESPQTYAQRFVDCLGSWIEERLTLSGEVSLEAFLIFSFWDGCGQEIERRLGYSSVILESGVERGRFYSRQKAKQLTNKLFSMIVSMMEGLGEWTRGMPNELAKRNSQPMLLPRRSFENVKLRALLSSLCRTSHDKLVATSALDLTRRAQAFVTPRLDAKTNRKYFLDDRNRRFFTPGRALHGGQSGVTKSKPHDSACFIASFFRFGFPIGSGFHFDTTLDGAYSFNLTLQNCHDERIECNNVNYVNIYPSDFARWSKK